MNLLSAQKANSAATVFANTDPEETRTGPHPKAPGAEADRGRGSLCSALSLHYCKRRLRYFVVKVTISEVKHGETLSPTGGHTLASQTFSSTDPVSPHEGIVRNLNTDLCSRVPIATNTSERGAGGGV